MGSTEQSFNSNHANLTCEECLKVLHMVIDRETEETEEFKQHLEDCLPCLEKYNLDLAIKEVLKKRCHENPPNGMIKEIKNRIFQNVR